MTQQHRILTDLLNGAVRPKCMKSRGLHHVPREHDAALTKPGNTVYFCTSRDARWTNHDQIIQVVI